MKRTIFVAALLLAGASSPVFASEKDGACTCGDSHHAMSEKKGTEPEDVGGGRGEPQRAQEQAAKQQQEELTSTQRKVLADWRSVEQLQQRVP
jgi:hypothetical protein